MSNKFSFKKLGKVFGFLVAGYLLVNFGATLFTNDKYHWDVVSQWVFSPQVLGGMVWTLILTLSSMVLAIILSMTIAIMRLSDSRFLRYGASAYIWFFRGTPIYTQLVFWGLIAVLYPRIGLGIPFTSVEFFSFDTNDLFTAAVAAIVGLALNEAAYLSEIFRAGISSVDRGQWEAGYAIGLRKNAIMFRIIIPQAMRVIIPPTGNETISMLKTTSLVLAVPFTYDLTYVANNISNRLFLPIPLLIVASIWYLVITSIFMVFQNRLEKHFGKGIISAG